MIAARASLRVECVIKMISIVVVPVHLCCSPVLKSSTPACIPLTVSSSDR